MNTYDVVIIGAGVAGASIARELSRYKLTIAVLEKEEEPAFGVSKSNSGIIHPGTQNSLNSLKGRLCLQGNILTRRISQELGLDFQEVGELIAAFNEQELGILQNFKKQAQALGVPGLKIVDKNWLRENEPNLSPEVRAALFAPTAGIISPYRLVYALCENAIKNGAEIYTNAKVEDIVRQEKYFEVFTSRGCFRARYVINAAGLFADEISWMAGISDFQIRPRKGEEFILDKKKENLTRHLIFPLPSKTSKGVLVIKTADGNPMIGPSAEDIEDKEDLSTTDEGFKKVLTGAKRLVPSINENDIIAYFSGLRPVALAIGSQTTALWPAAGDDFIIRYEDKAPGFINVVGIQSPGLTAAPAIARMVSAILRERGLRLEEKGNFISGHKKIIHLFSREQACLFPTLSQTNKLIKQDAGYGDIVCRCELVSAKEVRDAITQGARTLDGIKFRTRAQAGRCHGSFCTTRLMKILSDQTHQPLTAITKRGPGSEIVKSR